MLEVPAVREHHLDAGGVGGLDDLVVAHEPPGWMTAFTPASTPSWGPSENGKNASEASAAPSSGELAMPAFSIASRTESTRVIWPAPIPDRREVVRQHDRVGTHVLADLPGEQHLAPLGLAAACGRSRPPSPCGPRGPCRDPAPAGRPYALQIPLGDIRAAALAVLEDPHLRLRGQQLDRVLVKCGAMMTSQNCLSSASANGRSIVRLTQMTPPNADSGSHAKARMVGLDDRAADGHAAWVVVLD